MTILQEADSLIHGDRHDTYGHALDEYTRLASFVNTALATKLKSELTAEDLLLVMALMKINRNIGNPGHRDSRVDSCGYLGLIDECQGERKRRERKRRVDD